jgi:hypothetical protein
MPFLLLIIFLSVIFVVEVVQGFYHYYRNTFLKTAETIRITMSRKGHDSQIMDDGK